MNQQNLFKRIQLSKFIQFDVPSYFLHIVKQTVVNKCLADLVFNVFLHNSFVKLGVFEFDEGI